jgi:hypothetical protein
MHNTVSDLYILRRWTYEEGSIICIKRYLEHVTFSTNTSEEANILSTFKKSMQWLHGKQEKQRGEGVSLANPSAMKPCSMKRLYTIGMKSN